MTKLNYNELRDRADRLSRMIVDRARKTAAESGLSPQMPFLHAHNAMCDYGTPRQWPEVNYTGARKVLWLEQRSWEPSRIIDRLYKRKGYQSFQF